MSTIPTVKEILELQISDNLEYIKRQEEHIISLNNQMQNASSKVFTAKEIISRCREALKKLGE